VTPCGFQFTNQQLQWCPATRSPTSIGTIGPVNAQSTLVNAMEMSWVQGTTYPKIEY